MLGMRLSVTEADAVRAYIRGLRSERDISQDIVAEAIHMPRRTYIAWEAGNTTKDIKAPALIRVVKFLGGNFNDLSELDTASEAEAEQMARKWVRLDIEQRAQAIVEQAQQENKVPDTLAFVRQLRADPDALRELIQAIKDSGGAQ